MKYLGRIFLIVQIILLSSFASGIDGKEIEVTRDSKVHTVYSGDMKMSQQRLDKAFEPMVAMDKIYNPISFYSPSSIHNAHFYTPVGFIGHFETDKNGFTPFLQKIPIVDDAGQERDIQERSRGDCASARYMLVKKNSRIYLLTTGRVDEFRAIDEPREQFITIYVLIAEDYAGVAYFKQKSRFKSEKAVCEDVDVKKLLQEVASSKL